MPPLCWPNPSRQLRTFRDEWSLKNRGKRKGEKGTLSQWRAQVWECHLSLPANQAFPEVAVKSEMQMQTLSSLAIQTSAQRFLCSTLQGSQGQEGLQSSQGPRRQSSKVNWTDELSSSAAHLQSPEPWHRLLWPTSPCWFLPPSDQPCLEASCGRGAVEGRG